VGPPALEAALTEIRAGVFLVEYAFHSGIVLSMYFSLIIQR